MLGGEWRAPSRVGSHLVCTLPCPRKQIARENIVGFIAVEACACLWVFGVYSPRSASSLPLEMSTALNLGATAVVAAAILGRWSADAAPHGRSFCDPDSAWTSEFADEFDGSALNDEVWTVTVGKKATEAPLTHSAGESYFGADCLGDDCILLGSCRSAACTAGNVYLDNGTLVLRSQRQAVEGANYTTGAVTTRDKTTWTAAPGAFRMCISAKLPGSGESGQGIWPAHWLMPNDDSCDPDEGEIDIMEMVDGTGTVYGTYHWQTSFPEYNCSFPQNHSSISGNVDLSGTTADAHTTTLFALHVFVERFSLTPNPFVVSRSRMGLHFPRIRR